MNQMTQELNCRSHQPTPDAPRFLAFAVVVGFILIGAALRLVPHPFNFSPIGAMGLFGGAYASVFAGASGGLLVVRKSLAVLLPLATLFLSDLVLGFHITMPAVYGAFVVVTCLGFVLGPKASALRIGLMALASSIVFFVITNFAVWAQSRMYARSFEGLVECYTLAIPFFQNTLAGDLCFSAVLFGSYAILTKAVPQLQVTA